MRFFLKKHSWGLIGFGEEIIRILLVGKRGFNGLLQSRRFVCFSAGPEVTLQSRVASRNGLRSGVKAKRCPGLGVRSVRLEP